LFCSAAFADDDGIVREWTARSSEVLTTSSEITALKLTEVERNYVVLIEGEIAVKVHKTLLEILAADRKSKSASHLDERKAAAKQAVQARQHLDALRLRLEVEEPALPPRLQVGALGRANDKLQVRQVISKNEMVVATPFNELIWLRKTTTAGAVEGQPIAIAPVLIVSGTKSYTADGVTNTVFVAEPAKLDKKKVRSAFDALARAKCEPPGIDEPAPVWQKKAPPARKVNYASRLANARNLKKAKLYAKAEQILRKIVKDAWGTEAADEAQKELDSLPAH